MRDEGRATVVCASDAERITYKLLHRSGAEQRRRGLMSLTTEHWRPDAIAARPARATRQLDATVDPVASLTERAIGAVFDLYDRYYDATSRPLVDAALRNTD